MNIDDGLQLLEGLEHLLGRQIELARRGSFTGLNRLADECEPLVAGIKEAGLLEKPENEPQRQRLDKLYRDLQLMLSTQKDAAAEQLKSIHRGRKMLSTYRSNFTR
jgi:hypothetical protein